VHLAARSLNAPLGSAIRERVRGGEGRSPAALGSTMISWSSRKQSSIAQSTVEANYIAASGASREAVWLRKLLLDFFSAELEPTIIHYDNLSYIMLSENPVFHDRSKHNEMRYHYIRDMV